MKPFPYPERTTPGIFQFQFLDDHTTTTIRLVDEGGGHFMEIEIEGRPLRIDAKELSAIAQWCADGCAELDNRGIA